MKLIQLLLLTGLTTAFVQSQGFILPDEHLLQQGLDLMYRQEYARADSVMAAYSRYNPSSPAGPLLRASIIQYRCSEQDELVEGTMFDSLITAAMTEANRMPEGSDTGGWKRFFKGTALGLKTFLETERGNWISGIRRGLEANAEFEAAIQRDSTLYDGYLGAGSFAYWRSRKTAAVNWLPFFGDRREEGIRMVELCAQRGRLNRFAAIRGLVEMFLDAGRFRGAAAWSDSGLARYPTNRYFAWRKQVALFRAGDMVKAEAAAAYELLLLGSVNRPNPYAEIASRMNLAAALRANGNPEAAYRQLEKVLSHSSFAFPQHLADRAARKFSEARMLLKHSGAQSPVQRN